jgi:transcriptional regulator with XRE-family HTH domain
MLKRRGDTSPIRTLFPQHIAFVRLVTGEPLLSPLARPVLEGIPTHDSTRFTTTLIKAAQMTQVEVARKLGVGQGVVSRLEHRDDMLLSTLYDYLMSGLSAVVQRFLVSPQIAAIALREAGYIDEGTKQDWMALRTPQLAARFGWADQYQVLQASSDQRRAPQRLLARAIAGYVEGVLPAQAIATLRGISVGALMDEFGEAGVTPAERPIAWADPRELPRHCG